MQRNTVLLSLVAVCCCFTLALAGDAPSGLATASGIVDKVDKDALTVQPRGAGGKFGKKVVLKITGTSKVTVVSQEKRGGKIVAVQRDLDAKDLEAKQQIAVIYLTVGADNTLLAAVVERESPKK